MKNAKREQEKAAKKQFEKQTAMMEKEHAVVFTGRELLLMFNVMLDKEYKVGDAVLLWPALKKIEAIIAVDTNIPPAQQGNQPPPPEAKPNGVILTNGESESEAN